MTDDQLYRKYISGDMSAGDELMLRYSDTLTAYLDAFIHNALDAEDLMLDCFAVILVDKPKIAEGNFRAYLFKVARNKANRLWKMRFRRQEFSLDEDLSEAIPHQDDSPVDMILKNERVTILQQCLNKIAPQYREALWLVYMMDMSYESAASIMGCNIKKIENLLYNGKKQLRKEFETEGITHADI